MLYICRYSVGKSSDVRKQFPINATPPHSSHSHLILSSFSLVITPIVASGGAGKLSDFSAVFKSGHVDAALAASVFHYGEIEIADLKKQLHSEGMVMRL